jgi:hypothetical protein
MDMVAAETWTKNIIAQEDLSKGRRCKRREDRNETDYFLPISILLIQRISAVLWANTTTLPKSYMRYYYLS